MELIPVGKTLILSKEQPYPKIYNYTIKCIAESLTYLKGNLSRSQATLHRTHCLTSYTEAST